MRKAFVLAAIVTAPSAFFAACSGDETGRSTAGTTSTSSTSSGDGGSGGSSGSTSSSSSGGGKGGAGGSGGASGSTSSGSGAGGASSSSSGVGGAGGAGGNGSGGAGGASSSSGSSSGAISDAGAADVSFSYDADPGDGAVNADSACAADAVQGKKRPIDIIWAVDTSGSMSQEIAQIKANINSQFANILSASGLDYQVIMVAAKGTGALQVCVAPPLGGFNCESNPPVYHAVLQTVASTNSLSLLLSTYDSANLSLNWQQYLRFDAVKVFVEVTDDNSALAGASFDTSLLAKMPAGMFGTAAARNYVFHSIIGVTAGNPAVKCPSAVNIGAQYQVLSNLTGGGMYPVCDADYSPIFNQIANGIVGSLACEFTMPKAQGGGAVDPNNVSMVFTPSGMAPVSIPHVADAGQCNGDGWYYDNNAAPTKLLLCPTTCATAKADQGGKVDILLGCLSG